MSEQITKERTQACTVANFISNWNGDFPNYPLTVADLEKPNMVMGALFHVFDRLGIDRDAVLAPPPEELCNESTMYYWDLLPVINTTRVTNHLVSLLPQVDVYVTHFLQPTVNTSHPILLLLYNLILFNEDRLRVIAPCEEELFARSDQVKTLEDKKNKLLEMLNEQAEEKGKRAERLEKLNMEINQYEEELKQEKELHEEEKKELEAILKQNRQNEMLIDQKKGHRDTLLAEVARKKALRVYDADDIKIQMEQATQNVQEAEEKLNSLRETLMQKECSLKNLQTIKPSLDTANNLLHEIMKLSDSLKELEGGAQAAEGGEGEVEAARRELREAGAALQELRGAGQAARAAQRAAAARAGAARALLERELRDAEENDKICSEQSKKALERTEEIKKLTLEYEKQKSADMEELANIQKMFCNELKSIEDLLMKKAVDVQKRVQDKLKGTDKKSG